MTYSLSSHWPRHPFLSAQLGVLFSLDIQSFESNILHTEIVKRNNNTYKNYVRIVHYLSCFSHCRFILRLWLEWWGGLSFWPRWCTSWLSCPTPNPPAKSVKNQSKGISDPPNGDICWWHWDWPGSPCCPRSKVSRFWLCARLMRYSWPTKWSRATSWRRWENSRFGN